MTWTKSDIQKARKFDLPSLLTRRGYQLCPLPNENYKFVPPYLHPLLADVVIKHSFWIAKNQNLSGNTIDFFFTIEGLSFHQTMQIITQHPDYDPTNTNPLHSTPTIRHSPQIPSTTIQQKLQSEFGT